MYDPLIKLLLPAGTDVSQSSRLQLPTSSEQHLLQYLSIFISSITKRFFPTNVGEADVGAVFEHA